MNTTGPLKYRKFWLLAGWLQTLAVISLGIIPHAPGLVSGMDALAHFLQFAILMIWFGGIFASNRHLLIAFLLAILGTAIEISQAANIYRQFDLADIVANVLGVIFGLVLLRLWLRDWCFRLENRLGQSQ